MSGGKLNRRGFLKRAVESSIAAMTAPGLFVSGCRKKANKIDRPNIIFISLRKVELFDIPSICIIQKKWLHFKITNHQEIHLRRTITKQYPISNIQSPNRKYFVWILVIGIYLYLVSWLLEFSISNIVNTTLE